MESKKYKALYPYRNKQSNPGILNDFIYEKQVNHFVFQVFFITLCKVVFIINNVKLDKFTTMT